MFNCCYSIGYISVVTYRALMLGVTLFGTGRCNYFLNVAVALCRNNLCVTYCTSLCGCTSSCRTLGMTLCRNFSSAYCFTTIITNNGSRTCNCASSIYGCGSCVGVSALSDRNFINNFNFCNKRFSCCSYNYRIIRNLLFYKYY